MNKEDLRIVFMGTPDFAVPSLKAIIDSGYNVVGVITAPDKKAGRGRKINMSAVKIFALKNYLNILQPANLKDEAFLSELKALNPDLQVVVAFRMLPVSVWSLPPLGTFNLHASLLPQYRGAAPINYAIINGEKETGLTTFLLDDKIDTGRILMQERTEISDNDTAGTLHDRLMIMGSKLIVNTIDRLVKNEITPIDQTYLADDSDIRKAPKISKDDCRINWYNNSITIRNYVRGLSPYPAAMTILKCKNKNLLYNLK